MWREEKDKTYITPSRFKIHRRVINVDETKILKDDGSDEVLQLTASVSRLPALQLRSRCQLPSAENAQFITLLQTVHCTLHQKPRIKICNWQDQYHACPHCSADQDAKCRELQPLRAQLPYFCTLHIAHCSTLQHFSNKLVHTVIYSCILHSCATF